MENFLNVSRKGQIGGGGDVTPSWFIFTVEEKAACDKAYAYLEDFDWAQPLLKEVNEKGGIVKANMSMLFELRFAAALAAQGIKFEYEHKAGVGKTKIDFLIPGSPNMLVELAQIGESFVPGKATHTEKSEHGLEMRFMEIRSDAKDDTTPQKEMVIAQGKILAKVANEGGNPIKFPEITGTDSLNVILMDARGYLGGDGMDKWDERQILYGPDAVPPKCRFFLDDVAIQGLFEKTHPNPKSQILSERIHAIGFSNEKTFNTQDFMPNLRLYVNPNLPDAPKLRDLLADRLERIETPSIC